MSEITQAEYIKSSIKIAGALAKKIEDLPADEGVRMVYNEAITDAADFTAVLAQKNPSVRSTLEALEKELREKLILRKPE